MQTLIAVLAASLTLTFVQFGLGAGQAQAGDVPDVCLHRYNMCLSNCSPEDRRCFRGCRSQLDYCSSRRP